MPEKLTNPDKLIVAARESLNSKDRYEHNRLVSCKRGELDIKAAKPNVPRVLKFMDIFIKGLRERGHDIIIENDATYAVVNTQKVKISLREKTKRVPGNDRWQTSEYIPTGILIFKLDKVCYDKEWMDGRLKIEDQLSVILAKLEMVSAELNERDKRWAKEREEEKKKRDIQKAFEMKQQEDLANFKETLLKASRWHKTVNLRNYIDSVEQKALETNGISDDLRNWLEWARKKAEWYDPFIECEDELLKEVDRETLTLKQKSPYYDI